MSDDSHCPFCGDEAHVLSDTKLTFCANPQCPIYGHVCDTEKWNRRAPALVATLEALAVEIGQYCETTLTIELQRLIRAKKGTV